MYSNKLVDELAELMRRADEDPKIEATLNTLKTIQAVELLAKAADLLDDIKFNNEAETLTKLLEEFNV